MRWKWQALLLIVFAMSIVSMPAQATTRRPVPDFSSNETPPVFEESKIDSIFAARGERVVSMTYVEGFSRGGTRDATATVPGQRKYYLGTSDLERYEKTRRKVSQMNNWSVGAARANWLWAQNGYVGEVMPMTIMNHRGRGVYVIVTTPNTPIEERVPFSSIIRPTQRDTVVMEPRIVYLGGPRRANVEFRPTAGYSYTNIDGVDYATPTAGVQLLIRAHKDSWIGAYYTDGYTFAGGYGDRRRMAGIIMRDGDRGFVGRFGGTGAWTINGSSGLARDRALGMDVGLGYDFGPVMATVSAGVYQSASVTHRDPEAAGAIGLLIDIAPRIRL